MGKARKALKICVSVQWDWPETPTTNSLHFFMIYIHTHAITWETDKTKNTNKRTRHRSVHHNSPIVLIKNSPKRTQALINLPIVLLSETAHSAASRFDATKRLAVASLSSSSRCFGWAWHPSRLRPEDVAPRAASLGPTSSA